MKRKILFFIIPLVVTGMFALVSCSEESTPFTEHYAFSEPTIVAPLDGSTVDVGTATTLDLKWSTENKSGDPIVATVYFGTSGNPPLLASNLTELKKTVTVAKGKTYYWYVVMKDANGIITTSPTWSFTIFEPIGIYTGAFLCDEPAEDYSYDVNFSKKSDNVLTIDNYWNSGWVVDWTLNFTAKTYTFARMTFQTGWEGTETGTINPATGTMIGNYTIWHNGAVYETGVHTYTKY